jgi:large subunit ribosomal protein L1
MDDKKFKEIIVKLKDSKKRNFKQSVDLIINLRNLDLKKPEHQVEFYLRLPKNKGKKSKICAFVGPELGDQAKKTMDFVVLANEFDKYTKDKKLVKKLAEDYDFFVAQANIMPKVATSFGRILGPKGKMPNPKAGCIVPPNANLKQLQEKLQNTIKVSGKKAPLVQLIIGNEDSAPEELIENFKQVYSTLLHNLPQGENNVKSIYLKYSMGSPIKVM